VTESEHRALREQLGQLVLGHLDPAQETRLRAHVSGCATCQAEFAEIAPLADALARVDPEVLLDPTPASPSPDLGERILGRVAEERQRQRWSTAGWRFAAAGVAAAAVVAAFVLGTQFDDGEPQVARPVIEPISVDVSRPGIEATAGLVAHTWGTELKLEASGLRNGGTYRVSFTDDDGRRAPAGTFIGTGDEPVVCNLNAAMLRPDARSVEITDAQGNVVVSADLA